MKAAEFNSVLAPHFTQFVALKRACGSDYSTQVGMLVQFDRYLVAHKVKRVDERLLAKFVTAADRLTARGRANLFCVVWQALEFARRHQGGVLDLPLRPATRPRARRRSYVLTDAEVDKLFRSAARKQPRAHPLCHATYVTLFGILLTTGMRCGEAVALNLDDVDMPNATVVVRKGKFGKMRLIPLAGTTIAALQKYLRQRRRHGLAATGSDALFITRTGRRYSVSMVGNALRRLADRAGIRDHKGRRLRVHDLRHSFALRRVIAWHAEGKDVNRLLPLLSTYMGHVGVKSTQVYLQPTIKLLTAANARFECACARTVRDCERGEL